MKKRKREKVSRRGGGGKEGGKTDFIVKNLNDVQWNRTDIVS